MQAVAQLEAETQQVFQENQQLNKQSNLLNSDVGCRSEPPADICEYTCLCTLRPQPPQASSVVTQLW